LQIPARLLTAGIFEIGSSIFLYLPLAHSFARLMEFVCMLTPTTLIYPAIIDRKSSKQDPRNIKLDLAAAAARVVPTVPRLLEKIQMELLQRAAGNTGQGRLLRLVLGVADRTFAGTGSVFDKMLFAVTKPIRRKIRVSISGKNFSHFVSGGAKLPDGVARFFFTSLEIIVCEGYGLTESCVATNVNRLAERRLGSVGPALAADNEVRILDDGEILLRGPNIAIGYYNRPEATAATWDEEGWLHTGDLGSLDADGFLTVTGRKKELIVTAGGKKIPPIKLEGLLQRSRYISQVAVFGDGKPYCVAIATPQREAILQWLESNG
jgi:long-chain acyl-CoA synthetase